jgi:hypothetical protein
MSPYSPRDTFNVLAANTALEIQKKIIQSNIPGRPQNSFTAFVKISS